MTQERRLKPWTPLPLRDRLQPPLDLPMHRNTEKPYLVSSQPWQRQLSWHLDVGLGWDAGIKRKSQPNEDSVVGMQGTCIYNHKLLPFGLFIVADGMGGYANGKDASYLTIQTMLKSILPQLAGSEELGEDRLIQILLEGVQRANITVYQRGNDLGSDMGTTITAALVLDKMAYIVNVGDSRTYLYREDGGLSQVTRDHSHVARLVEAGKIAPDDIYTHPERNQIYRGLGDKAGVEVDWFTVPLQMNDRLLLCSDGLWEMVRNPEIEWILKQPDSDSTQKSKSLVKAALKGGGLDNISAIVVRVTPVTA
jgi:serine/threonine protein phosphatase PrpC